MDVLLADWLAGWKDVSRVATKVVWRVETKVVWMVASSDVTEVAWMVHGWAV
jgi:hypothetical protein